MMHTVTPGSAAPLLDLNSGHFFALAVLAVFVFRLVARGPARAAALLGFNLYFLLQFLRSADALLLLAGLLLFTYAAAELRARLGERLPGAIGLAVVLLFWAFLFCVKDPALAGPVNPFHRHPVYIIGISYIVFRCIHYYMDAEILDGRSLVGFVNYCLFFPTLLSGPIERYERFQAFQDGTALVPDESPLPALHRIANGLFKKFVLADNLIVFSIAAKPEGEPWSVPLLWLGTLLAPVLLYLDFSGYCDVMIGLARLMGCRLAENFDRPWLAQNIQEFWNRWHITLSHFVRDYVYNPVNRLIVYHAPARWQFALVLGLYLLTMLLIALWHGTTWGFLMFGLAHGLALVLVQCARRYLLPWLGPAAQRFWQHSWLSALAARAATYSFIALSMVLWSFGVSKALVIYKTMLGA